MKEKREDKLLRLWKNRQEAEGYDVSKVKTLKQAEKFFDKPQKKTEEPPEDGTIEEVIVEDAEEPPAAETEAPVGE